MPFMANTSSDDMIVAKAMTEADLLQDPVRTRAAARHRIYDAMEGMTLDERREFYAGLFGFLAANASAAELDAAREVALRIVQS